jgi:hypothetical protein
MIYFILNDIFAHVVAHLQEKVGEPVISILAYLIKGEDDEIGRNKTSNVNSELLEEDLRDDAIGRDARCDV